MRQKQRENLNELSIIQRNSVSLECDFVSRKAHWVVVQSYARDDGVVPYVEITDLTGCM